MEKQENSIGKGIAVAGIWISVAIACIGTKSVMVGIVGFIVTLFTTAGIFGFLE